MMSLVNIVILGGCKNPCIEKHLVGTFKVDLF